MNERDLKYFNLGMQRIKSGKEYNAYSYFGAIRDKKCQRVITNLMNEINAATYFQRYSRLPAVESRKIAHFYYSTFKGKNGRKIYNAKHGRFPQRNRPIWTYPEYEEWKSKNYNGSVNEFLFNYDKKAYVKHMKHQLNYGLKNYIWRKCGEIEKQFEKQKELYDKELQLNWKKYRDELYKQFEIS